MVHGDCCILADERRDGTVERHAALIGELHDQPLCGFPFVKDIDNLIHQPVAPLRATGVNDHVPSGELWNIGHFKTPQSPPPWKAAHRGRYSRTATPRRFQVAAITENRPAALRTWARASRIQPRHPLKAPVSNPTFHLERALPAWRRAARPSDLDEAVLDLPTANGLFSPGIITTTVIGCQACAKTVNRGNQPQKSSSIGGVPRVGLATRAARRESRVAEPIRGTANSKSETLYNWFQNRFTTDTPDNTDGTNASKTGLYPCHPCYPWSHPSVLKPV